MADYGIGRGQVAENAIAYIVIVFNCIAIYNVIELSWMIWTTFKRHGGLYFWSFIVATYGIAIYSTGFILDNKTPTFAPEFYATCISFGWAMMVTGQSMVLYSRLHLVLLDRRILRAVLCMIITDAVILHIPVIVFIYGANSGNPGPWLGVYSICEKIQVSIFFVQELIISFLYIHETLKTLRLQRSLRTDNRASRRLLKHLIIINIIIILLDIVILALEYANKYTVQTSYKAFVYSVKLKLEFSILNGLVKATKARKELTGSDQFSSVGANIKSDTGRSGNTHSNAIGFPVDPDECHSGNQRGPMNSYRTSIRGDSSFKETRLSHSPSLDHLPNDAIEVTREVVIRSDTRQPGDDLDGFTSSSQRGGETSMSQIETDLRSCSQVHLSLATWPNDIDRPPTSDSSFISRRGEKDN